MSDIFLLLRPRNPLKHAFTLFFFALSLMPFTVEADWMQPPHEELAAQSDLVVFGKCTEQKQLDVAGGKPVAVAIVRVESLLQGDYQGEIVLKLPLPRPGGLVSSADVVIETGQEGLWYLQETDGGMYVMSQPYRFLNAKYAEPQIRDLITRYSGEK